nr:unnamed protein product [Digitaria exilis]
MAVASSSSPSLPPRTRRMLPSTSSTATCSFVRPGTSIVNTWASRVSFQSIGGRASSMPPASGKNRSSSMRDSASDMPVFAFSLDSWRVVLGC